MSGEQDRVRVGWLIKGLGAGGAEQLLLNMATVADQERFEYTVAHLLSWKDALVPRFEEAGIEVVCLNTRRVPSWAWLRKVRSLLQQRLFDVVHVHSPALATVVRVVVRTLPRRRRPAVVTTEHNVASVYGAATRLANWLTAPLDDARFAVSEEVRRSMPQRLRATTETLVHGVVVDELHSHRGERARVRRELGLRDDDVLALTVSNYRAQKGYSTLFAAAKRVIDRSPVVRFAAVGQGPLQEQVLRWNREHDFGDRFVMLGYRTDVPDLLAAADLFVVASDAEGLPVAVMEALVMGLPIVATRVGGIPEVVTNEQEGLLVPRRDPDALAEAIIRVVDSPELRRSMAAAAEARGETLDIRRAVRRYEDEYRRLAARRTMTAQPGPRLRRRQRVTKPIAALGDLVRRPRPGLVVLAYHRVGRRSSAREIDLPTELFDEQMAVLAAEARVVTLDEGVRLLATGEPGEQPLVAITFDDGTADFADVAVPVLERHRLPATLYLATDFVESGRAFPDDGTALSWAALRDAIGTGLVEVGSHTHRHLLLDRLPDDQVADELDRSIGLIRERLGVEARHFSYPKAVLASPSGERAVRERFRSAALSGTRANPFGATDPYRLARSPIQVSDAMRWFRRKVAGGMWLEGAVRAAHDARRYADRVT